MEEFIDEWNAMVQERTLKKNPVKRASLQYAIDIEQIGEFLRITLTNDPNAYSLEELRRDYVEAGGMFLDRAGVDPLGYHLSKGIGGWMKVTMMFANDGASLSRVMSELNKI
jgi:hypothetical protein